MRSLEILTTEHTTIRLLVDALDVSSARLRAGADSAALIGDILAALVRFVERVHMVKEEEVVFPYLHDRGLTRSTAVVCALAEQHEAITVYGRRLGAACERATRGDASAREELCVTVEAFVGLLREHMRIEEQYFYQLADQMVEPDDHDRLSARFREIDRRADAPGAHALAEGVLARVRAPR